MGDSDDEYDRKRRDKFRGERGEASYRGTERPARPRDDWVERWVMFKLNSHLQTLLYSILSNVELYSSTLVSQIFKVPTRDFTVIGQKKREKLLPQILQA